MAIIKGIDKEIYPTKNAICILNLIGSQKNINYENIKKIEYLFAQKWGYGYIIFVTRTNEKEKIEFKQKFNEEILKLIDFLRKKYPNIEFIEKEEESKADTNIVSKTKQYSGLKCPICKSHNIDLWSNEENYNIKQKTSINLNPLHPLTVFNTKEVKKEKTSAAKIGLGVMTGGASILVTGIKKKAHNEYYCRDCGNRWIAK